MNVPLDDDNDMSLLRTSQISDNYRLAQTAFRLVAETLHIEASERLIKVSVSESRTSWPKSSADQQHYGICFDYASQTTSLLCFSYDLCASRRRLRHQISTEHEVQETAQEKCENNNHQ